MRPWVRDTKLVLYHITTSAEVETARHTGQYVPHAFDSEGFIHCSHAHQVRNVANRLFAGRKDLVLLVIDPSEVPGAIVEENLEGGEERYPHIYGRLPMASVVRVMAFPSGKDGQFAVPDGL